MAGIDTKKIKRRPSAAPVSEPINFSDFLNKDINISFSRQSFDDRSKESFYLELSTLLNAGLDIKASLELIESELEKTKQKQLVKDLKQDLIDGYSLWEAMQRSSRFTPYEYYSIQIGEETGKMILVLDQLHQFYASKIKQQRQFVSALSYPVIILFTSIGAVSFMLLFIVPMFSDVFKRFGGELPYLTKLIIHFSELLKSYFLLLIGVVSGISVLLYRSRKKNWMKKFASGLIRKIPVVGSIVYTIQLARFYNSMALLLGSKIPLVRALTLIRQMITFYPLNITFDAIAKDILDGNALNSSMAKFDVYSKKSVSLLKVGEEVNKLDVFFDKLAKQASSEVDHKTGLLNTFLEPAMIIFLGFVVGFILLAMYMPMFQLSTSIGQ